MKSLLSKLTRKLKVHRKPIADCDCTDFFDAIPEPPSREYLKSVIKARYFDNNNDNNNNNDSNNNINSSPFSFDEETIQNALVRSTLFDLTYRCGAAGRCTCASAPQCRFPNCFVMRPSMKGADVYSARQEFEVDDPPTPEIGEMVKWAREDNLERVIGGIEEMVSRKLRHASRGRPLTELLQKWVNHSEYGNESLPTQVTSVQYTKSGYSSLSSASSSSSASLCVEGSESTKDHPNFHTKTNSDTFHIEVNPLRDSNINGEVERVKLRDLLISLIRWRAALLVNLRKDDKAVNSLLNLADVLQPEERTLVYTTATRWAILNDMEIIYYRHVIESFKLFEYAFAFATRRPMLLSRVIQRVGDDRVYLQYCTRLVLSCEVEAIAAKAQAAQVYDDLTEDPMFGMYLPLALSYYRFRVHDQFWGVFFNLLCLPPMEQETSTPLSASSTSLNSETKKFDKESLIESTRTNLPHTVENVNQNSNNSNNINNTDTNEIDDQSNVKTNTPSKTQFVNMQSESYAEESSNNKEKVAVTPLSSSSPLQGQHENVKISKNEVYNNSEIIDEHRRTLPPHIVDAIGRSMILHHLIKYAEARIKEIDKGIVHKRVNKKLKDDKLVHDADFDYILSESQIRVAATRLRQLLMVIKEHEIKHHEEMLLLNKLQSDDSNDKLSHPTTDLKAIRK